MSYILDALKRADTERERERGTVPGLHSQNLPSGSFQRDRKHQSAGLPPYATWLGLLILALVVGWYFWPSTESRQETASVPVLAPGPAPSPAVPTTEAPVSEPAPSEPLTAQAPDLPILAPPPAPPPAPPRAARTQASGSAAGTSAAAEGASTPPAQAAVATTPAATTGTAAPVRRFAELSPELRAQLPQVNVSGSTYSSNPKLRTLIANGKVIQEGDEIAPGLQVETIGQRSAVLNFQGTRYSIGF